MATNFPSSLDSSTQQPTIASSDEMDDSGKEHDVVHTNHSGAIIALETKLGTGDSNAVADAVLMGTGSGTSGWDTSPTFKGAVTVGVDDTGHDVKFFGATSGKYFEWDESIDTAVVQGKVAIGHTTAMRELDVKSDIIIHHSDLDHAWLWSIDTDGNNEWWYQSTYSGGDSGWSQRLNMSASGDMTLSSGALFATAKMQTGQSAFTQEPWSASTIMLGDFGSIGTQGSYRTTLAWNWERGSGNDYQHLNVNSYNMAGAVEIGNGGVRNLYDADWGSSASAAPRKIALFGDSGIAQRLYGQGAAAGPSIYFQGSGGEDIARIGPANNDDIHIFGLHASSYCYMGSGNDYKFYFSNANDTGWYPYEDNIQDLGWSGRRFDDIYATNSTINTSDISLKKDIVDTTLGLEFIKALRPVEYKWKDGTRKHQGFIAQEVEVVLNDKAVAAEQGMWGVNTIKEGEKVTVPVTQMDEVTGEKMPVKTEVDNVVQQMLRYSEFIAPIVKSIQELEARVASLEG